LARNAFRCCHASKLLVGNVFGMKHGGSTIKTGPNIAESMSALSLIATGKRRVDVDDLWALAVALQTTPYDLMGVESAAKPLSPAAQQIVDLVTLLDFKGDLGGKNWDAPESYRRRAGKMEEQG
jgi:transcriptional regulator with XRE-family HTH domain